MGDHFLSANRKQWENQSDSQISNTIEYKKDESSLGWYKEGSSSCRPKALSAMSRYMYYEVGIKHQKLSTDLFGDPKEITKLVIGFQFY